MQMQVVLQGNFDSAVLFNPDGFCEYAERSILWTQAQLKSHGEPAMRQRRANFLKELPKVINESDRSGNVLYVHGSARNPVNEYVLPEDIYNDQKMKKIGVKFDHLSFCGHTHIPGLFIERSIGSWEYIYYEECEKKGFPVAGCKLICNVGSVGQSRDEDERACYVLFDGERIWFRRVNYELEATIQKIYAVPELGNFLGDRLREGR
jgi:diadenosine tetraphosphatase ApaH/serine/threonine PP2A family protein phosphatase